MKKQPSPELEVLHVMPGFQCNFECSHCCNNSGPSQRTRLTENEIEAIKSDIRTHLPPRLIFTGGEPTLHIDLVNEVINAHPSPDNLHVLITTNGWYAKSDEGIVGKLGSIKKVSAVQLSYDTFHGSRLNIEDVKRIQRYCSEKNIDFNISICITNPTELIKAHEVQLATGAKTTFQKTESSGRAKTNNLGYQYPTFQKKVLESRCPNLGSATFIPQKGFSICCSNLVFNRSATCGRFTHSTLDEHFSSPFFSEMASKTFGEMLEARGISKDVLKSEHSAPCKLCDFIHAGGSV